MSSVPERIKIVRKANKLSQEKFGSQLGVSRDVITSYEVGRVEPKESFLLLVCKQFEINYDWLLYGDGEMKMESDDSIITAIKGRYAIDDLDEKLIREYLELTPDQRTAIKDYFKKVFG